jgi:MCP1-like protein
LQKYSSYTFSAFTVIHITNTAIIPLVTQSVAKSDSYLLLTRPFYQNPPQEQLLVGLPIAIHVLSGLALRLYRRRQHTVRYGGDSGKQSGSGSRWPPVSGISKLGYTLIPMVVIHGFVVRGLPLWLEGSSANSGLGYVAHGFARLPLASFIGYTAIVGTLVSHVSWGWAKWLGFTPNQTTKRGAEGEMSRKRRWYIINGIAGCVALVWWGGGLGVIGRGGAADGWLASVYDGLYKRVPVLGKWI